MKIFAYNLLKRIISLVAIMILTMVASAQSVTPLPYFCGFEDAAENANWVFASRPSTTTKWIIGEAAKKLGRFGMYVSNSNGTSATFDDNSPGYVIVASREFNLPAGHSYMLTFSWKALGDGTNDAFRVGWMSATETVSPASIGVAFPNYMINNPVIVQGGTQIFSQSSAWKTENSIINIPVSSTTNYKLVFAWKADGSGSAVNPGACIDNIQIDSIYTNTNCRQLPANISVENTDDNQGIEISWNGSTAPGVTYDVIYARDGSTKVDTITGITGTSVTIPYSSLNNGRYTFYVRMVCADGTSIWVELSGVKVIDMSNVSINPRACPEITFETQERDALSNIKVIKPDCKGVGANYTVRPMIGATGASIAGYAVLSIPFNPPYPIGSGTQLTQYVTADDVWSSEVISLPFPFCFFENTYDKAIIGANGTVSFNIGNVGGRDPWNLYNPLQPNIPSPLFRPENLNVFNSIFGVYEDIYPPTRGVGGGIFEGILGEYPCRTLCVSYKDIALFGDRNTFNSYQIVLYEGSNAIDVYVDYRGLDGEGTIWNDNIGIIGLINSDGTDGIAAPGRNTQDPAWSVTTPAQREGWRFVPITTPSYDITWYKGKGINGQVLGNNDTLNIQQGDGNDILTVRLQFTACNGDYFDLRDTAIVDWSIDTVHIKKAICGGDVYTEHGFNESKTGSYSKLLKKENGCDSIYYLLDLTVGDLVRHSQTTTICTGEKYTFHNQQYTTAGDYIFKQKYANIDCDSLSDTLHLLVVDVIEFTVTKIDAFDDCNSGLLTIDMPADCYYTLNGVRNAPLTGLAAGRYTIIVYNNAAGCQSLPQTVEIISEPLEFYTEPVTTVCGNEDAPPIIQYTVTAGLPSTFSLIFDAKAQQAGFVNIVNQIYTGQKNVPQQIQIQLPANVRPDHYSVIIDFPDLCFNTHITDTVHFDIKYPANIITQRWNDVLSVMNKNYNGGYEFDSFQWYKNTNKLNGETGSYIYVPEGLDMTDCYSVELVRKGETTPIFTCDYCPVPVSGDVTTLVPNPVSANSPLKADVPEDATVSVFNTQGIKISEHKIKKGINTIISPSQTGIYLYKIMLADGDQKSFTISVK